MEPGGWCSFVREGAVEAYPYAIASLQAYVGDSDLYEGDLPMLEALEALPIDESAKRKGFGYVLFNQFARGTNGQEERQPIARILAFRGTDFAGFTDIFYGSLRNDQIDLAVEAFAAESARFDDDVRPQLVSGRYRALDPDQLNNAWLLSRILYYTRLDDFETLYQSYPDLKSTVSALIEEAGGGDPWEALDRLLERASTPTRAEVVDGD